MTISPDLQTAYFIQINAAGWVDAPASHLAARLGATFPANPYPDLRTATAVCHTLEFLAESHETYRIVGRPVSTKE